MDNIHNNLITIKKAKEIITLLNNLIQIIAKLPITQELQNELLTITTDVKFLLQDSELK